MSSFSFSLPHSTLARRGTGLRSLSQTRRKVILLFLFSFLTLPVNYSFPPRVKWQCHKGVCIKLLNVAHNSLGVTRGWLTCTFNCITRQTLSSTMHNHSGTISQRFCTQNTHTHTHTHAHPAWHGLWYIRHDGPIYKEQGEPDLRATYWICGRDRGGGRKERKEKQKRKD